MSLFSQLTRPNDDVYVIVQLDTIEQYKRHHPKLDNPFQDTIVMIVSKRLVLQKSLAQIKLNHLQLEFVPESVEMSNHQMNKIIQYMIENLLRNSLDQSNDHENIV